MSYGRTWYNFIICIVSNLRNWKQNWNRPKNKATVNNCLMCRHFESPGKGKWLRKLSCVFLLRSPIFSFLWLKLISSETLHQSLGAILFTGNHRKIPENTGKVPENTGKIPENTGKIPENNRNIPEIDWFSYLPKITGKILNTGKY